MTTLILATRNLHKVAEIRAILGPAFAGRTLAEFPDAPPVHEDAPTFEGNAAKKAGELAAWLAARGGPTPAAGAGPTFVLADDSGLEVDALHGAPGVHSARYAALDTGAAGNSSDAANLAKLLRLLAAVPPGRRTARFRCVLALIELLPGAVPGAARLFSGACEGHIAPAASGRGGFGYDPVFIPAGHPRSFAELGEAEKNRISHRSHALAALQAWFAARDGKAGSVAGRSASPSVSGGSHRPRGAVGTAG